MRPRTAMVLAAGLGTRMQPLSATRPKPLIALADKPLLDHVLDRLAAAGIEKAVVNVHYLADQIEGHLAGRRSPEIEISDERGLLLDTGGGVMRALPQLGPGSFFVHNSDSVWVEGATPVLTRLAESWDPERMDALLLLAVALGTIGYAGLGDFAMEADGRLRRRLENEIVPFVFAGVSIAHPRLLDGMPEGAFSLNLAWNRAIEAGRLYGMRHDGIWMHVGTPAALADAERCLQSEGV